MRELGSSIVTCKSQINGNNGNGFREVYDYTSVIIQIFWNTWKLMHSLIVTSSLSVTSLN